MIRAKAKAKTKAKAKDPAAQRLTRRAYLRSKPPVVKSNGVVHLDAPSDPKLLSDAEAPVDVDVHASFGGHRCDVSRPEMLCDVPGHGYRAKFGVKVPFTIFGACVLPVQGDIATAGEDGCVRVWDSAGEQLHEIVAHDGGALFVSPFPNGKCLLTGGCDGYARVWKVAPTSRLSSFVMVNHKFTVVSGCVFPNLRQMITLGLDGVAKIWRLDNEEFLTEGGCGLSALVISPYGGCIVTASSLGSIEKFSDDGQLLCQFAEGHEGLVNVLMLFPDQSRVLTAGEDGQGVIWDSSGELAIKLEVLQEPILCADISPCGNWILTGSKKGTVRISNAAAGRTICSWQVGQQASSASARPDSSVLEVMERTQLETCSVQACCFCPSDRRFVLAGAFGLQIWQFHATLD
ncbi:unnamed protein product [Symbiodinium natans]|uniref:Uncharacterized protein n=1 Tax=Symbiodinium natans TaxID=878477 RepID=A0A812SIE1_9DINO|nr:unnamed protein product [Symbiodinium natans]